ncbi:protein of unknown function [Methylocella tundrae]|uniref:Uncharacterized protein n=1 Tax=Methylocella tundrae TaxID=227605 RepID=A0A4U8YYP4_METTU|nr:protein of unknown function [Methylocella tundrae]
MGAVAQMGERCNRTAEVRGSIPLSSTNKTNNLEPAAEVLKTIGEAQGSKRRRFAPNR